MIEPLVLLPGLMCDARLFEAQITALSHDRAVTVAPITGGERIEEIASGLLDQLPHRFALCGFDLGGGVALEIVRRAPERVTRLCLLATDAQVDTPLIAAGREELIVGALTGQLDEVMRKVIGSDMLAPGPRRIPILNDVLQMAEALGPDVFVRQMRTQQRRPDQHGTFRRIRVPTLVICGAHDVEIPVRRHAFIADLIPDADLRVIDEAGHFPTLETPETVNALLQGWLQVPLSLV
ncbi:alpha/beta fold hydrolase [uncultured Ruegeria sp.]|uniref:alpha/beta fold hydrolase n=1 Tax=uncultured Ruegeria sp. TaxID=259304 RepID=UPI00262C24A6|nr:alpha/beta fold hydrolase [uncultured Ruegeria sp.]